METSEERTVTFKIYRDDFVKALCYIMTHLPLYVTRSSNSTEVKFSYDLFASEFYAINSFFKGPVADYTATLYYRKDGRKYLKDLSNNGFNIRNFFIEEKTRISFLTEEKPVIRVSLADDPVEKNESILPSNRSSYRVYNTPLEKLAVRDKVLKDFIYKVIFLIHRREGLSAIEPYITEKSKNMQLIKKGAFRLTGMFICTTYSDLVKRNKFGFKQRWFDTPFTLKEKTVYLSTQWYGNGNYSLMYRDFTNLILSCFNNKYRFKKRESGEFELWVTE
jgi:hypothetical protein